MEDKIKSVFKNIRMREVCVNRIVSAVTDNQINTQKVHRQIWRSFSAAAAAILLLMLVVVNSTDILEVLAANYTKPIVFETPYYTYNTIEKNCLHSFSKEDLVRVVDGRLFFVVNGENIDITDQISLDNPFCYTFIDRNGVYNFFAIGGQLGEGNSLFERIGYHYYMYLPDGDGDGVYNDGGSGCGAYYYDQETGSCDPWREVAEKKARQISFSERSTE